MDLADYSADPTLSALTRGWLDLFWQDSAMDYNTQTGLIGASGSRAYQMDPDNANTNEVYPGGSQPWLNGALDYDPNNTAADYYTNAIQGWSHAWTYLYGWHGVMNGVSDLTQPQLLPAATSTYVPLAMSEEVANMTNKDESYLSARPGAVGGAEEVAREVTVNDAFMLGAQTYSTDLTFANNNNAMLGNIWYSVAVNNGTESPDRVMVSGVA